MSNQKSGTHFKIDSDFSLLENLAGVLRAHKNNSKGPDKTLSLQVSHKEAAIAGVIADHLGDIATEMVIAEAVKSRLKFLVNLKHASCDVVELNAFYSIHLRSEVDLEQKFLSLLLNNFNEITSEDLLPELYQAVLHNIGLDYSNFVFTRLCCFGLEDVQVAFCIDRRKGTSYSDGWFCSASGKVRKFSFDTVSSINNNCHKLAIFSESLSSLGGAVVFRER